MSVKQTQAALMAKLTPEQAAVLRKWLPSRYSGDLKHLQRRIREVKGWIKTFATEELHAAWLAKERETYEVEKAEWEAKREDRIAQDADRLKALDALEGGIALLADAQVDGQPFVPPSFIEAMRSMAKTSRANLASSEKEFHEFGCWAGWPRHQAMTLPYAELMSDLEKSLHDLESSLEKKREWNRGRDRLYKMFKSVTSSKP